MQGTNDIKASILKEMDRVIMDKFMRRYAEIMLADANFNGTYYNVTGNTATSTLCGLYRDGALVSIESIGGTIGTPKRNTLRKGEMYDLDEYYGGTPVLDDGRTRPYIGETGRYSYDARQNAISFLKSYQTKYKKGYSFVMCVGTQYADFLQKEKGRNVLNVTQANAEENFMIIAGRI